VPLKLPTVRGLALLRWRQSVFGKVNRLEVRLHAQTEVAHLRHVAAEVVAPLGEALRAVRDPKSRRLALLDFGGAGRGVLLVRQRYGRVVDREDQIVVDGPVGR